MAKKKSVRGSGEPLRHLFRGVVTVGNRGQIVLPAEVRRECEIKRGDKFLVFTHPAGIGLMLMSVDKIEQVWIWLQEYLQTALGS